MPEEKHLTIEFEDWDHTCSDGCCYMWGTNVKVNGVELDGDVSSNQAALRLVLEHLGYTVEIK